MLQSLGLNESGLGSILGKNVRMWTLTKHACVTLLESVSIAEAIACESGLGLSAAQPQILTRRSTNEG